MPSRSGTIFTFEDGMVSRYPRDTPIPPKLNILSTGQVYMGESEMDMSTKKSIVAAKEKELRNERTRDLRRARNPSIRSQKAIAKQQRREERVKRRVARKAARKARRAAAHERQGSGRKGRQKPIGPRTDETEVSPQTLQQMQQESSKRRETRRGTESEDY
ncbi:hypothetical protein N7470_007045 [Penicillium chermesinum]|nr:hypothetical protein N7470_007045 [Penicillium chermesinum]